MPEHSAVRERAQCSIVKEKRYFHCLWESGYLHVFYGECASLYQSYTAPYPILPEGFEFCIFTRIRKYVERIYALSSRSIRIPANDEYKSRVNWVLGRLTTSSSTQYETRPYSHLNILNQLYGSTAVCVPKAISPSTRYCQVIRFFTVAIIRIAIISLILLDREIGS
jgi:hypothetical protein